MFGIESVTVEARVVASATVGPRRIRADTGIWTCYRTTVLDGRESHDRQLSVKLECIQASRDGQRLLSTTSGKASGEKNFETQQTVVIGWHGHTGAKRTSDHGA